MAPAFFSDRAEELLEHQAAVAIDGDVDAPVAAELRRVEIDLDDLGVGRPGGRAPVVDPEVEGRSEDEDAVRLGRERICASGEEPPMLVRERAAGHAVQVEWGLEGVGGALHRVASR